MTTRSENQILYRRFLLVTLTITILGMALAQIIESTHNNRNGVTVHNRTLEWRETISIDPCGQADQHCTLWMSANSVA